MKRTVTSNNFLNNTGQFRMVIRIEVKCEMGMMDVKHKTWDVKREMKENKRMICFVFLWSENLYMQISRYIGNPFKELSETGKLSGVLLILATVLSLSFSNSQYGEGYLKLWQTEIGIDFLHKSFLHWINDGFMVVFFLLVGLEIKRELLRGELSSRKRAILPVVAAIGGMVFPALIFLSLNLRSPETIHGWAIPVATDIAFSLGILSLLGNRVPLSLKVFLTALAIIDDLGAIIIIAFFYTSGLNLLMLFFGLLLFSLLLIMNTTGVKNRYLFLIPGVILWYFIMKSGVHATIAGILLAFAIPMETGIDLEHRLQKPVNYFILPAFALANTAIPLSFRDTGQLFTMMSFGIIMGLVIGKPLGIFLFSWGLVKLKAGSLPKGTHWKQIIGLGILAGIGFTMSIFIGVLSFTNELNLTISKLAILAGSTISAITGFVFLLRNARVKH